jgi:purine-binding chemotaxis protein CheW
MSTATATATATAPTSTSSDQEINSSRQVDSELLQLVTFMVGAEEFAIPILSVQEINRMMQITRVPQSPPFIEGVINLRGKIIPVMDLRKRFGDDALEDTSDSRIIVIEVATRVIGFTVDRVNEVLRIDAGIVEPPPSMVSGVDSDYVQGVGKLEDRLLILLNLDRLFSDEDLDQVDKATHTASA